MQRYRIDVAWSDEDQAYVAFVPDLPGCMAHGDTREQALASAQEAIEFWLDGARELGRPIPAPGSRLQHT